jgi:hypothetical protein
MFVAMKIAVQKTLDKYGVQRFADVSGLPFWTLRKWRDTDRIPGKGVSHQLRVNLFKDTAEKLKAEDAAQQEQAA